MAPSIQFIPKVSFKISFDSRSYLTSIFPSHDSEADKRLHTVDIRRAILFI